MKRILVIDDDRDICFLLNRFLTRKGYQISEMYSGKKALASLDLEKPDLIISDFRLEDMDGTFLLTKIKEKFASIPVIFITGFNDTRIAVTLMKMGAFDYVTKPLLPDEILLTIQQALGEGENKEEKRSKMETTAAAPDEKRVPDSGGLPELYIFTNSPTLKKVLEQVDLVAPTAYSVIIYGETGCGKEAIAREIHKRSNRRQKPFIAIDCGALSKELSGSELFGHEKGAFTGALNQKIGSFELVNGGTIFLDEVSNLSYDIQVSLLRVVQERKMRRVGGTKDIDLDMRIIIASNELLWDATRNGKFREDLYHRFNEFVIHLPPLRERKEDIMLFANHFLQFTNRELGKKVEGFSNEVENILKEYIWYGNLRELKNVIKRAVLLTETDRIEPHSLPFEISNFSKLQFVDAKDGLSLPEKPFVGESRREGEKTFFNGNALKEASLDVEYELILNALKQANYNKSKAAQILKIDRKTLYNKMNQYNAFKNQSDKKLGLESSAG
jgi:two-component system, NtrC family, response regulator HydG